MVSTEGGDAVFIQTDLADPLHSRSGVISLPNYLGLINFRINATCSENTNSAVRTVQ